MIEFCALILRLDVLAWNIFEFTCVWYLNFLRILRGVYYNTWFLLCFIVLTNVLAWLINLGLVISPAYQVLWNPFKDIIRKELFSILRRRIYDEYNKKLFLLVWKLGRCMNSTEICKFIWLGLCSEKILNMYLLLVSPFCFFNSAWNLMWWTYYFQNLIP